MADGGWQTWRDAWQEALYGQSGFYRRERPSDHFRTSVSASPLFARTLVDLVRRLGLSAVTDLGAGSGELLGQIAHVAPDLTLTGVELRPRPAGMPAEVSWATELPRATSGLLLANEVLDNVPCDVVELDARGTVRLVEVQAHTGLERLGPPPDDSAVAWLEAWWPLERVGQRAEIGLARDEFWAEACGRVNEDGACLAIDYGHLRGERPAFGTVASYARGRQVPVALDGRVDVTAHVAVDSVAAAVGGALLLQRDALLGLGVTAATPRRELAKTQPAAYVRALSRSSQVAELVASPGLGDFHWIVSPRRQEWPDTPAKQGHK